jgi:undecaprenyl diphosphate synthase
MDGNRRWAKQKGLHPLQGHEYVANTVIKTLVTKCIEENISHLTLWAFSTENWNREENEVAGIMELFRRGFSKSSKQLHEMGVRLNAIGDLSRFPEDIQTSIRQWIEKSAQNQKITVTFALNYGGRDEITRAVNKFVAQPTDSIADYLDTAGMPDPDLIIRPGGEKRLSGFLPWQGVYSELYFTDVLMPDFQADELDKAIQDFHQRHRRFGK